MSIPNFMGSKIEFRFVLRSTEKSTPPRPDLAKKRYAKTKKKEEQNAESMK